MAQSGWRLPDDLLRRIRVRAAEEGVRQNVWVARALESALSQPQGQSLGPSSDARPSHSAPSRAPASNFDRLQGVQSAPSRASAPSTAHAWPDGKIPSPETLQVRRASSLARDPDALARQARLNKGKGL